MAKPPVNKRLTSADYERLGRTLENIYEYGYIGRWRMYKMSFFKGVAAGLGGVIGATLVLAIFIWFLSLFDHIPLIGPLSNKVQSSIQSDK